MIYQGVNVRKNVGSLNLKSYAILFHLEIMLCDNKNHCHVILKIWSLTEIMCHIQFHVLFEIIKATSENLQSLGKTRASDFVCLHSTLCCTFNPNVIRVTNEYCFNDKH